MIKVAIADDHPLLLEGLKDILIKNKNIDVVAFFNCANQLVSEIHTFNIDVLLLDINLGDANSIEIIKTIKNKSPEMDIIMLSVHNELPVINSAISQGAKGYIQKNASVEEIFLGIEKVFNKETYYCKQTINVLKNNDHSKLNTIPKLTRREKEILCEAALGLTTNQIADKLFISHHTVESHRKNLIEKFQTNNLSSAIKLAFEYGIIVN
nr:response regulator transcription factor [uncultured Flavobacterium sp.]